MTKEYLEAFETVYNNIDYLISDVVIEDNEVSGCLTSIWEQLPTIKQAIQRLEAIDNSTSSEALMCLDSMYARLPQWDLCRNLDQFNTIKQALLKAQKEHKALEIIFKKKVNIYQIKYMETLDDYNSVRDEEDRLTQEEFDLLKEVLK